MSPVKARTTCGFTLIELLITVALLGIIATLAVGGYRQYVRRAARVDATSALLRVASAEEKFYAQNGRYADTPAGLGIENTERGYYALAIQIPAAGPAVGFTATATVNPGSSQADDEDCWVFSINERGLRNAESRSGDSVTDRCWR